MTTDQRLTGLRPELLDYLWNNLDAARFVEWHSAHHRSFAWTRPPQRPGDLGAEPGASFHSTETFGGPEHSVEVTYVDRPRVGEPTTMQSAMVADVILDGEGPLRCGTGGVVGTGGIIGTDGVATGGVATGGVIGTGGGVSAGGVVGTGGDVATGGVVGTGGDVGTGGSSDGGFIRGDAPTVESATAAGPYDVQTYTNGFRDGPAYADATIHYPTDAEPPLAGVAVVPGFVSPQSSIQPWGPFLASHGIVTMTIGTNNPGDTPDVRAQALLDALETLRTENTRAGGQLQGKLDTSRFALMGWSMGGGGTLIASSSHPELKAAITLCAWSPGVTFPNDVVPTLLFASLGDPLAGGQSQGFYESIPQTTPKMLIEVPGGDHYFANTPAGASGQVGRYGLSWMKVFLEGDERYRQFLEAPATGTTDFRTNL